MFHPTLKLSDVYPNYSPNGINFNIVQIGTGGNGGYLVQRLAKLLYALQANNSYFKYSYKLVDGDKVEQNNLLRQPFIEDDLGLFKAQVLAERYGTAYDIPIHYRNDYITHGQEIVDLFNSDFSQMSFNVRILIGCVDNNATRQIMHEVYKDAFSCVYLDSGIDGVDAFGSKDSGYSGHVVCGAKFKDIEYLSPVGQVYPDILLDKESRLPTQACGLQTVYYPQRMQTNELAALVMNSYLNTLLSDHEIVSHHTNFNARTSLVRPTYINEKQVKPCQAS